MARLRATGQQVVDLTVTNPTAVGLIPGEDALRALGSPAARVYAPHPRGLPEARAALAERLSAWRRRPVDPTRLLLVASTSEAYAVLFKLLCDAGDEVLVPQPSYPLFEHLAALEIVRPVPYRLEAHDAWSIDRDSVSRGWSARTRAVIVVSPNNPTGSYLRRDDRRWLLERCARAGCALIVDEVFSAFPLDPRPDAVFHVLDEDRPPALVFALGGCSKRCALPQLKVGWIDVDGPGPLVDQALARLDLILDTYLSVNGPVQAALPQVLAAGETLATRLRARLRENLDAARALVAGSRGCTLWPVEGGWSVVLRVPAVVDEETLVVGLLEREGVLVHPGYFFDFPFEAFVIASLITEPAVFADGLDRVVRGVPIA